MGGKSSRTTFNDQSPQDNYDHQDYSSSNHYDQSYGQRSQPHYNFYTRPAGQTDMPKSILPTSRKYDNPYDYGTSYGQNNKQWNNSHVLDNRPVAKMNRWKDETHFRDSQHEEVDNGWGDDTDIQENNDHHHHHHHADLTQLSHGDHNISPVTRPETRNNQLDEEMDKSEYDHHFTDDDEDGNNDGRDSNDHTTPPLSRPESTSQSFVHPESDSVSNPHVDFSDDEDEEETNSVPDSARAEERQRRRVALIFGNDKYVPPHSLYSCCKDAQDINNMLTSIGFECTLLLDGTQKGMQTAEKTFYATIRQGDCVLVYFSGHGMEDKVR